MSRVGNRDLDMEVFSGRIIRMVFGFPKMGNVPSNPGNQKIFAIHHVSDLILREVHAANFNVLRVSKVATVL